MTTRTVRLFRLGVPLTMALLALPSCGSNDAPCPACPATYLTVGLAIVSGADGGAVSGVEVTLSGPQNGMMSCESSATVTLCTWPGGPVIAGSYSLQVTAPGFQSANVDATVTTTPAPNPQCGCAGTKLQPSMVTLAPS